MKTFLSLALVYFACCSLDSLLFGDSKSEAALKNKVATQEIELAKAAKEKAELTAAVSRLSKATVSTAANQESATTSAKANAEVSQAIASENGIIARDAAVAAEVAAATAKSQNFAIMVTQVCGFAIVLVGLFFKVYTDSRDRKWAIEDATRKHDVVIEKIGEVKEDAKQAYKEANDVNNKIVAAGIKFKPKKPLDT